MTSSKRPSSSSSISALIRHASFVKIDTFPLTAKSPPLVAPQYLRPSRLLKPRQSMPQVCATMKLPSLHVTTTFHTSCMALSRSGPHCFELSVLYFNISSFKRRRSSFFTLVVYVPAAMHLAMTQSFSDTVFPHATVFAFALPFSFSPLYSTGM